MKHSVMKRCLSLLFMLFLALQMFPVPANAAGSAKVWLEAPLNYDEASDVNYVEKGNTVANWGVRGEHATFMTDYAENYYTDEYAYEQLITNKGASNLSETPSSPLYTALADMMNSKAAWATSYDQVRDYFKYTDCVLGDYNYLSSFYSGVKLDGDWVTGAWNREHVWPNSKIDNVGENDLMMLRPTSVQENSGRGNTAFGESEGYYDPNAESDGLVNLRGDCARIVLYTYVRWGVTDTMWGSSGVIQSRDILLKWLLQTEHV